MDPTIRLAIISTSFPRHATDGAGIFVLRLVKALEEIGASGIVVAPTDPMVRDDIQLKSFSILRAAAPGGVLYGSGGLSNLRANPFKALLLPIVFLSFLAASIRAAKRCDIMHAHWIFSALVAWVVNLATRKPYVMVIRGEDQRLLTSRLSFLIKLPMQRAKKIVVVSEVFFNSLPDEFKSKATFIPNGVEPIVNSLKVTNTLGHFGLSKGKYIVSVGRVYPLKRPELLIEALKDIPRLKLVLVGQVQSEKYKDSLTELAVQHGVLERLVFTGAVAPETALELISAALLTISASAHEGRPNSLLEAMALGVPVVASDIPAHNELLRTKDYLFSTPRECSFIVNKISLEVSFRLQAIKNNLSFTSELTWNAAAKQYLSL